MKRQVRDNDLILDYLQSVQESRPALFATSSLWSPERKGTTKRFAVAFVFAQIVALFVSFGAMKQGVSESKSKLSDPQSASRGPASFADTPRQARTPLAGDLLDLSALEDGVSSLTAQ